MSWKSWIPHSVTAYLLWLRYRRLYPKVDIGHETLISRDCKFGEGVCVRFGAELTGATIADYSYIGSRAKVLHAEVGKFCSIAPDSIIGGYIHPTSEFVSSSPAFFSPVAQCGATFVDVSRFEETRHTIVGSDVWLGSRAIVLPGVTVGHGAIVGAGAVVTANVEPYTIVAGAPARLIRYRFAPEVRSALLAGRWWDRDEAWLRKHAMAFNSAEAVISALASDIGPRSHAKQVH